MLFYRLAIMCILQRRLLNKVYLLHKKLIRSKAQFGAKLINGPGLSIITRVKLEIETFHEKNQINEIIFLDVISIYLDQSNYIFGRSKILF